MSDVSDIKFENLSDKKKSKINDFNAGISYFVYELGLTLSTFYGVYVSEIFGFRLCCDFVGFACFGVAILYLMLTKELPKKEKAA
jgi:hypothetical protein